MTDSWSDVELERASKRIHRENLEQLSNRSAESLSDEELFELDFKAYNARLELRRVQQREDVLQRYGVPEDLERFIKLAQDPTLQTTALKVLEQHGALSKEVFELVHALADPARRTTILSLAKTLDRAALDQELYEIWANQPRLAFCSTCRAIGYWRATSKPRLFHQLCTSCATEDGTRRDKHAYRDFSGTLSRACSRARKVKLPATLTKKQWLATLQHFQYRCGYCADVLWEVIEHATPIERGGGTTWSNCLPACSSCNARKEGSTIEELPLGDFVGFDTAVIAKAREWLHQHGRKDQSAKGG